MCEPFTALSSTFTPFYDQTAQLYSFRVILSSCGVDFDVLLNCLDQNFVHGLNRPIWYQSSGEKSLWRGYQKAKRLLVSSITKVGKGALYEISHLLCRYLKLEVSPEDFSNSKLCIYP